MHNLTKTLAAMTLLAPMSAHSLGVGDIKLHSALNQKLNAEIALSLSAGEELADVKISLASPDKFDQAGIAWSSFLSKVKFEPILKANGQVVIKVTSHEAVQEPFLDFLVEVSWPKGDIFKEFTVLVDPPVVYLQSAIEAPAISTTQPTVSAVNTNAVVQNDFSSLAVEGEYGPTNRSDSLWKVAEKVNTHNDVSVEQMMMALYKANPRAFYKKNVNALMAGKSLKIPEKPEIVRLSKKQANTEFYNQMAVWEGKAIAEPEAQLASEDTKSSNQLTLVPPTEELIGSDALSADTADIDTLGLKTENQELQERLANLEKQFVIMQEMLAIKDQQLAAIQNAQIVPESQHEEQEGLNVTDVNVTDQSLVQESLVTESPVTTPTPTVTPEKNVVTESPKQTPLPVVNKPAVAPPVVSVTEESESSGFNYSYLGFGLGGLVLVGLALLLWRRRQAEEEINDNSMFASSSEIILPTVEEELSVPVFDETPSYDVGTVGESSFLSEFTPSDFDVFESDQAEVDPSSEADVYLAYGRYQQAEELMRQAIKDFPDKDDYKLKLLEIFYASENSDAFAEFSTELVAEGKNSDVAFWGKVSEMGGELVPGSDLFSAEQRESKFDVDDDFTIVNELPTISEPDKPAVVANKEQAVVSLNAETEASDNSEIDFDLSSFSLMDDEDKQEPTAVKSGDDIESVDFDLSSFDTVSSDTKKAPELNAPQDLETFDFDQADATGSSESLVLDDDMEDVNLDEFDFSSDSSPLSDVADKAEKSIDTVEEVGPVDVAKPESNDFDFDFDFDDISDAPVAEKIDMLDEDNLMVSDLTDMDEFETKIDLAKAYIDMGDADAAKDIAQEVLEKGTDTQKQEAQAIIDKLV
ncbi:MAG: fimbrial protein FimV [Gammaproteobacteria bacterium]|nr:MAG: fimbrial protein FimV [Gammaproteobacteria bacterium]